MVKNSSEYMRLYYHTHKEKYNCLIKCEICDKEIQKQYYKKHCDSKAHKNNELNKDTNKEDIIKKVNDLKEQIKQLTNELKITSKLI